jgi:hypothetical protein
MSIAYKNKVNERLIGSPISGESHTIGIVGVFTVSSGNIRLIEVPQGPAPAVIIPGYNEIITGSPTGVQFIVNYETGVITFNASENGNVVSASYTGLGSEIAAEDINELQIPVGIALNADGSLSAGIVTTASISGSAVIPFTNIQTLNNSIVPITSGSGVLISSATTVAELAGLHGLTPSRAIVTDGSGILAASSTTATELGYVHGVTSDIQTQINGITGSGITALTGDVTATGPGSSVATLSSTAAVKSLHADSSPDLTANVQLVSGTNVTLSQVGQAITINVSEPPAGITALTGDVTTSVSPSNPYLNTAAAYAVLAETAVTNTGSTVLTGNLGISPNNATSITGFPPGTYSGAENAGNAAAATALADATSAAATLTAMGPGTDLSSTDLGGYIAVPGVYSTSSTATWGAGPLTLFGAGTYIFLIGSSLTMPANATVVLEGGAVADNVYFVTVTTFTFGSDCTVNGTILAGTSITFASNSVLNGRALLYGPSGTTVTFPSAATVVVPPGSGGVEVATLATVNSNVGSFTWTNFTVNAKGLITAASSNATPVTSITGTANEVIASASTGAVTLSLPQAIATTSSPTFDNLTVNGTLTVEGTVSLNAGGTINDNGGHLAINLMDKTLHSAGGSGHIVMNWEDSVLISSITGNQSLDWNQHQLQYNNNPVLTWSGFPYGISLNGYPIHNVADPVAAQDAATKNYVDMALPFITTNIALINQNTDLGPTILSTPVTTGVYRVSIYLVDTVVGTVTITANLFWTDDGQAETASTSPLLLTALGYTSSTFYIEATAGNAISYSLTNIGGYTTDKYSIYITLERLS